MNLGVLQAALQAAILDPLPAEHPREELSRFYRLLRDYPERGGKRLRGLLVLLSAEAHGGRWQGALQVASALELFQNWVLIHDDIEDDSDERRSRPALHKQVGMPVALNVGDALHVYMWETLTKVDGAFKDAVLAEFVRMIHRTAEGQHLDLSWVAHNRFDISEADYLEMVTLKSARYTVVSPLRLGALCALETPRGKLEEAGKALGVAFQIRDDVLNLSPGDGYGKEFAGDLFEAKRTLILAHLFSQVTAAERQEVEERLAKPRTERTRKDVERVLELIHRYRSLDYAQGVAEREAEHGLSVFNELARSLADQPAARELSGLLESLANRRA